MYETFARVYDTFMDEVPYDDWASCLICALKENGIDDGLVLDLGCGTGQMTRRFAEAGYDMIGVDLSPDMLQIAQEGSRGYDILYLMQDVRRFELYGTVRAVISTCDSLNYITDPEDLLQVFRLVNNYLDPGGIFLFDMNSRGYFEKLCADNTFAESRDECSFIWENGYDPDTRINEYDLTLFCRQENGMYERFLETHTERAYTVAEIRSLLEEAGMKMESARAAYTDETAPKMETAEAAYTDSTETKKAYTEGTALKLRSAAGIALMPEPSGEELDEGTRRILFQAREHGKSRRIMR